MFKPFCFILLCSMILFACKKDDLQHVHVVGSVIKNAAGDCMPITVGGTYNVGHAVSVANYLDIQVHYTGDGGCQISSDTINGYWFKAQGFIESGVHIIRLQAHGTPISNETDAFTLTLGSSSCEANVTVTAPVAPPPAIAVFTLGGAGGPCTGAVLSGTYTAGTILTAANTVALNINTTVTGTYNLSTPSVNGVVFSGSGTISTTGPSTIILTASGTGTLATVSAYPVAAGSSTCSFAVTYN